MENKAVFYAFMVPAMPDWGITQVMEIKPHNFWYAVNNTEIVLMPKNHLETFGATHLHYHLISELMDSVNRIRIREGTIRSRTPQIITPAYYAHELMDGFGEQANQYLDWLREHAKDLRMLEYGFKVQKTELSEQVVTGNLTEIVEQVKKRVLDAADPLVGVILGVDNPWDVCLIKFMVDVIRQSAPRNMQELAQRHLWDDAGGAPRGVREEIESLFQKARHDAVKIKDLGMALRRYGLFEEYEDRFFALIRQKN